MLCRDVYERFILDLQLNIENEWKNMLFLQNRIYMAHCSRQTKNRNKKHFAQLYEKKRNTHSLTRTRSSEHSNSILPMRFCLLEKFPIFSLFSLNLLNQAT